MLYFYLSQKYLKQVADIYQISLKESNEGEIATEWREKTKGTVSEFSLTETYTNGHSMGHVNLVYQHDPTLMSSDSDIAGPDDDTNIQVSQLVDEARGGTHSIILDVSTVSFVDTVSVKTLKNVCISASLLKIQCISTFI